MAIKTLDELKSLFAYGDSPQEMDYIDLIDTLSQLPTSTATVSGAPPSFAIEGQLWYNTAEGSLFVYADDFWVEVA